VVGELPYIEEPKAIESRVANIYQILESDDVSVGELINPLSELSTLLEGLPSEEVFEEEEELEEPLRSTVDDCRQFLDSIVLKNMGNQTQND
jgi:hypothetical protein